jgi:Tol biopolymer transport system component
LLAILLLFCAGKASAQYFGQNKPRYKTNQFKVLQSPHFELYYYLQSDSAARRLARLHEWWYGKHQAVLGDSFTTRNPVIFYNHHADFQQTTAIAGTIGIGTGGVTEGLKNRVVMPFLETNAQTAHVVGHELVHAFQYHLLKTADSLSLEHIRNLPLWLVEGMAEYLSTGRVDAHTAMWMRDAVLDRDIPTLKDLTLNPKYFPYRYGQAFWAYVTGIWGEKIIRPLFLASAKYGYAAALDSVLGLKEEAFSEQWKNQLVSYYEPLMADTSEVVGQRWFSAENAGNLNISPVYSPDAQYLAFISEKDVLSPEIYLAEVKTGRILRKLSGSLRKSHIDDFNYVESVGTFSPDSRQFAFTVFSKGRNALVIVDVRSGKTVREISLPGLEAFNYPNWSPDGRYVVVSGLAEGQSDLFLYDLQRGTLDRLTADPYSDIHASFSPDGLYLVFASDRGADTNPERFAYGGFRLCLLELASRRVEVLDVFPGAANLNPQFSPEGHMIYFLSDADGLRNLYEYSTVTGEVYRLTRYFTGISGITAYSPALTVARDNGLLAYCLYREGKYTIYRADPADFGFVREHVDPRQVDFRVATLPPVHSVPIEEAKALARALTEKTILPTDSLLRPVPYRAKFQLDYIGNTAVGIAAGRFGTGLAGGVNTLFSDMVGNHQLFGALALNGEIYDLGGQLAYFNLKRKWQWGATLSHIPYQSAAQRYFRDTLSRGEGPLPVVNQALDLLRTFETQTGLFTYRPLSQTQRLEAGASLARYYYRLDRISNYYHRGYLVNEDRERLATPRGYTISQVNAAYVGDNAQFGTVGPLQGRRYRLGVEQYFGAANLRSLLADYRQYIRLRPVSLALRFYHYGRYGADAESGALPPLFLGFPTLVRGYDGASFYRNQSIETGGFSVNQLSGSRILVANAEIRLPFTGPERLSLLKSGLLPTEWSLFLDGGLAWDSQGFRVMQPEMGTVWRRQPVFSTGLSLRFNLLGYLVIEPYYALPLQREFRGGVFGLNFTPGW